jgi:hypothetical protein
MNFVALPLLPTAILKAPLELELVLEPPLELEPELELEPAVRLLKATLKAAVCCIHQPVGVAVAVEAQAPAKVTTSSSNRLPPEVKMR